MHCQDSRAFWIERLNATRALIIEYETAALGLTQNTIQSYTIDTGQTKQTVTRSNLYSMTLALEGLYNRAATLEARLGCGGTTYARPVF